MENFEICSYMIYIYMGLKEVYPHHHFKLKIWFLHYTHISGPMVLKFYTVHEISLPCSVQNFNTIVELRHV